MGAIAIANTPKVHYMCFDKFLFWVESRDLSQADKSNTRVSSFFEWNEWFFFYNFTKKKLFGTWKFGKIDVLINFNFFPQFSQFFLWEVNLRGLRAFILQNVQGSVVETEKKVLLPITQLGKEETLIILLSAWDRSRDSTQKRNLSKHMWRTQYDF